MYREKDGRERGIYKSGALSLLINTDDSTFLENVGNLLWKMRTETKYILIKCWWGVFHCFLCILLQRPFDSRTLPYTWKSQGISQNLSISLSWFFPCDTIQLAVILLIRNPFNDRNAYRRVWRNTWTVGTLCQDSTLLEYKRVTLLYKYLRRSARFISTALSPFYPSSSRSRISAEYWWWDCKIYIESWHQWDSWYTCI